MRRMLGDEDALATTSCCISACSALLLSIIGIFVGGGIACGVISTLPCSLTAFFVATAGSALWEVFTTIIAPVNEILEWIGARMLP